ncbi:MAG: redox-sensing transcriptional repressor Rex [Oscillospiraceae bacterium]|nr:redox-sensing transcriptional repressor Rex [Oscillospiraceae bacterium]
MEKQISKRTLYRLPVYLSLLQEKQKEGVEYISATTIANLLGLNHVQVRKDLSCASNAGRPKVGYETNVLISDLQEFLDYNNAKDAVIVGAGDLGKALLGYNGFRSYGLNIVAAFDINPEISGTFVKEKPIFSMDKLPDIVKRMNINIGIITTPAHTAQSICDLLVKSGVKAIWNFAPTSLKAPADVIIQSENMATGLAILSSKLNEKMEK